ncbi:phosphoglycerate mutase family protein [Paludibacter sp. 221]|uniref:phosphoglycerate mutase family protein n=1 Tax=Paludibacter sp. 221 TaxID=2302939 RepID=UPI0013D27C98|nr:phosphoglycerate mutase family protein [Paludibacter sp. 221]NDV47032.1 phosphoglycerate mutase family protein [Paludibacter sp. 221]
MRNQTDLLKTADENQKRAFEIIKELRLVEIWQMHGARANLIGSVPNALIMKNKDIDFHIYSDAFSITDSFAAIAEIAKNSRIKRISYDNLLDTDEMCIEWHAWYQGTDNETWQIDMIHILNESPYAGKMEEVTRRIKEILTPEMRLSILSIKNDIPDSEKTMGIVIYMAVIRDGIRNYEEFIHWKQQQQLNAIIDWMP